MSEVLRRQQEPEALQRKGEAPRRKGWCPGALRPMETGDGLLVRVRASGGRLTLDQAGQIAAAALACGSGALGLSARANLQIRGVTEILLPELQARLDAAGLLDDDPEVERLRNLVVSPLSDIDPDAACDLAPAIAALEARLAHDIALRALPAKFSLSLDAGGRMGIGDIGADIRFRALRDGRFSIGLAGDSARVAPCAGTDIAGAAARLARAFLALNDAPSREAEDDSTANAGARRMRALVGRIGAPAIFAEAGLVSMPRASFGEREDAEAASHGAPPLGVLGFGGASVVGVAAPFGALDAARLAALVGHARQAGAESLRLTPWRALLIAGLPPERAAGLAEDCARLGLILDPADPRLRVVACPGAPACAHALAPLHDDAARFAGLLPKGSGVVLHLSGCAKGCARPEAAPLTLVASGRGYGAIVNGRARDIPEQRDLAPAAIAALIASRKFLCSRPSA